MNERYIRIFTLEPKHEQGEVSVVAGALLYDREKDRKLAQIKLQSNETRKISRVVVLVIAFDSEGTLLGEPIRFEYRDPEVDENGCFGTRNPIDLPTAVSSFSASVERVVFENRESEQSEYYISAIERKGKGLSILLFSLAGLFMAGGIALCVVWYLWTTYDFTAFSTVRLLGILAALSLSIGLICLSIQLSRKLSKMKKILCLGIGSVSSLAIGIVLCLVLNGMSMSLFYQRAEKFYSWGEYHRAMGAFDQLPDDYRDSQARAQECRSKNP